MVVGLAKETWRFLSPPNREVRDEGFRKALESPLHLGLRIAGILAVVGTVGFVAAKSLLAGGRLQWSPLLPLDPGDILVLDKAVTAAAGLLAVEASRRQVSLAWGRGIGAALGIAIGAATLYSDAFRGAVNLGYLTAIFAVVAVLIPFRPWQTFSIGAVFFVLQVGASHILRPALGLSPIEPGLIEAPVEIAILTMVMTGMSAALYRSRYRQYQARHEAEKLRDEIAELERAKSRFFANVSHELRTPLTTILGPLEDALGGRYGDLPDRFQKRLGAMKRQAERLRALVNQLLRLSKLEEGRMELEARPIDLGPFLTRMKSLFRSMADRQGAQVRVETEGKPSACADPEALKQIVSNLLSNALEHTPEGGAVRLRAEQAGSLLEKGGNGQEERRVKISVRDSGPGLPEEVQGELFERYVCARTEEEGALGVSTGIGLAVVRELAERHGGTVAAESEPGFGTEMTVALPGTCEALPSEDVASGDGAPGEIATEEAVVPEPAVEQKRRLASSTAGRAAGAGANAEGQEGRKQQSREQMDRQTDAEAPKDRSTAKDGRAIKDRPTVLIVDDEREVREYLREVLTPRYAVRLAADGEEALEVARDERPALVISDVVMPRRDGYELCRAIRADERLRAVPVILLTVQDEQEDRLEGLQEGADAYLAKPFHPEELRQRVENLIGIRRYLRSQRQKDEASGRGSLSQETDGEKTQARVGTETEFLRRVRAAVDEHLGNSNFGVEWLADEVGLSTRQLQRRLQKETGLTAAAFIRAIRMERAAELLEEGVATTVKAAADAVGYRNPSYFSRLFKEAHGAPPSDFKAES